MTAQQTVTVRNLIDGTERQVRVRSIEEWAAEMKAKLAERWDQENPDRPQRNPWRGV